MKWRFDALNGFDPIEAKKILWRKEPIWYRYCKDCFKPSKNYQIISIPRLVQI